MHDAIDTAHFWIGFRLFETQALSETQLLLRLEADPHIDPRCGRCQAPCGLIHERRTRRVRERHLFDRQVWLEVPLRRVVCLTCGVSAREVTPPDLSRVRRLIMDEFALFKGHRYATVALCADTQQVLWVGQGRSRKDVRPFFEMLGPEARARIEAVAMDMNTAMDLEAKAHCPNIRVVYDLFHVIAKFGREVIDRVRVDQANVLKADPSARRVIKRSRWLLLRNRGNLTDEQAVKLDDLLAANAPLTTVYVLKAQLKELWYAPDEDEARRRWNEWHTLAMDSRLPPLIAFAKRLAPYIEGIVASAIYQLNTSVLEGMNNRIKVIKRMAYGYRDFPYFFLKIKAAFPGKAR